MFPCWPPLQRVKLSPRVVLVYIHHIILYSKLFFEFVVVFPKLYTFTVCQKVLNKVFEKACELIKESLFDIYNSMKNIVLIGLTTLKNIYFK